MNQQNLSEWDPAAALNLATTIQEAFFKPKSEPQRRVVMGVTGYGEKGKPVVLKEDGNEAGKPATCYAEVRLNNEDLTRSEVWQVLSKPATVTLLAVLKQHGPDFAGNLVVDIWTEGRDKLKQFFIQRITPESIEAEKKAREAIEAAKAAKKAAAASAPAVEPAVVA